MGAEHLRRRRAEQGDAGLSQDRAVEREPVPLDVARLGVDSERDAGTRVEVEREPGVGCRHACGLLRVEDELEPARGARKRFVPQCGHDRMLVAGGDGQPRDGGHVEVAASGVEIVEPERAGRVDADQALAQDIAQSACQLAVVVVDSHGAARLDRGRNGKQKSMPRAIWSGSISFGLVSVPVKMYSAIDEQDVHFHLLHEKDDSRIGYEKICKKEGKAVPDEEIVRGYEVSEGKYVYLTDEDLEAAAGESYRSIDILDFVDVGEVDPIYFERPIYLGPADGGEKPYALLVRAMEKSGLVGIATYVMRDKQQLGCLRVWDGVIVLEKMFFADEIRPTKGIKPRKATVAKQELAMALDLIDRFRGGFEPEKYEDTYRKQLLAVIDRKRKGKDVHLEPREEQDEPTDILDALRASVEAHSRKRRPAARKPSRRTTGRRAKRKAPARR